MASACGGHSSPPPWWRSSGGCSSSCCGGPSSTCGLFAATATSNTRYGLLHFAQSPCRCNNKKNGFTHNGDVPVTHGLTCPVMAFSVRVVPPSPAPTEQMRHLQIECIPCRWLLLSPGCCVYQLPLLNGGCCMTDVGGMRAEAAPSFDSAHEHILLPHQLLTSRVKVNISGLAPVSCDQTHDPAHSTSET